MRTVVSGLVGLALVLGVLVTDARGQQQEGHPIVGVDIGFMRPIEAFDDFAKTGGILSPFAGYMVNDYIGLIGQAHVLGAENRNRPGIKDDDAAWAVGGTIGPKFALPISGALEGGEIYGTWQGGIYTGLAPHSPITDTSFGYTTGAGINLPLNHAVTLGLFGRFNRLSQRAHGVGDVQFVTGGLSVTWNPNAQAPTPPPPPPPPTPEPTPEPTPKVEKKIILRGVNFDFDKATIRPDARPVLDEAVSVLKEHGGVAIIAAGHTDSIGTESYNQRLSIRRATAVKDYLVKGGIDASRIEVKGYGESRPVATNDTKDGRAQNRRVELKVVD